MNLDNPASALIASRDQAKQQLGGRAAITWIVVSAGLFWFKPESGGLISLSALLFVAVGMFVAALLIGGALYLTQRLIVGAIVLRAQTLLSENDAVVRKIRMFGFVWTLFSFCICIAAPWIAFNLIIV